MANLFKKSEDRRTFWVVVLTYLLDLLGYSIVFPILAPLLLNPDLHYFSSTATLSLRTTLLGLLFASFGITQFLGAPINGALADHFGRKKIFLLTIFLSIFGYSLCAFGVYRESLTWLFTGRLLAGFCSGNIGLAQSTVADLTTEKTRSRAFGTLLGSGSLGFIIGPIIGGRLANPAWLHGAGAFLFGAVAACVNLLFILLFFKETLAIDTKKAKLRIGQLFSDIISTFRHPKLRPVLITSMFFCLGWAFFLVFSPTFLVQRFHISSELIGDFFAYNALTWFLTTAFINKELAEKAPLKTLILIGLACATIGVFIYPLTPVLWSYWLIIPFVIFGGGLSFVNTGTLISVRADQTMQGKALGANGSMWSLGQAVAPIIAGPLAGWNIYSPLIVGSLFIFLGFFYFFFRYRD